MRHNWTISNAVKPPFGERSTAGITDTFEDKETYQEVVRPSISA